MRQPSNRGASWIGGLVLLLLGGLFLLRNLGFLAFSGNWWTIFIFIPAVVLAATAWQRYTAAGHRIVPAVQGALIGSLVLLLVGTILLFELDWGTLWPLFLIIAGVGLLLGWVTQRE
jgi:hypothetical protein